MNEEQIKRIIDSPEEYDDTREVTMRSWLGDFYSKKMRLVMINVFACYLLCLIPIVFCAIQFFRTDQTRNQIIYAVIVVCCSHWIGFVSVFGWVMMQRPSISRKIKRLELSIAELRDALQSK